MTLSSSEISSNGFWLTDSTKGHCTDNNLLPLLTELFTDDSVLDLGCGTGEYSKHFIKNQIPSQCYDGNPNTELITNNLCSVADLTTPQTFNVSDWVMCLEVGEHIPQKYESIFVQNIISHAKKGIVLSWAIPGQPGDGHINCRPNKYVISLVERHGFKLDIDTTRQLRDAAELWWFKNTLLVFNKVEMPKITFCIPSKSNLRYLKTCIPSIRENAKRKDHDIIVFVDSDTDGTVDWLTENAERFNINFYVNPELNHTLFGIGRAYDFCIDKATTDIVMVFHADMMLGPDADYHAYKHLQEGTVVCSTRIEPPLHPNAGEKILMDFGMWPEEFRKEEFNTYVNNLLVDNSNKTTEGIFAPWMIFKKDLQTIGGHDPILHSAREDSDIFNRFLLVGYTFVQSWDSLVYHLTGRGGQFQHGVVTQDDSNKSEEWQRLMMNSTKEFIRKWGSIVKHTPLMKPIVPHKYDIKFIVTHMNKNLLNILEPMCNALQTDLTNEDVLSYISVEQKNTKFDLSKRLLDNDEHDIVITFDASKLNNQNFNIIQNLSEILADSDLEIGEYEVDIFRIKVNKVKFYEQNLINIPN